MVDALHEIHRVLKPGGLLLDLRPQAADAPVEVVDGGVDVLVCRFDGSPGEASDTASDAALRTLEGEGAFTAIDEQHFLFHDYWDSVEELHTFATSDWNRYVIPTLSEFGDARRKMAAAGSGARLRTTKRLRLIAYRAS